MLTVTDECSCLRWVPVQSVVPAAPPISYGVGVITAMVNWARRMVGRRPTPATITVYEQNIDLMVAGTQAGSLC